MIPHTNTDALSLLVFGDNGHVWVLRKGGRRGSIRMTVQEALEVAKDKLWMIEAVPDKITGSLTNLNEAYGQFLYMREYGYYLSAQQWLETADKLASQVSGVIDRSGYLPRVIYLQEAKRPVWAEKVEDKGKLYQKYRKPKKKLIKTSFQLVLI